jgi:hypothetical protein
VSTPQYPTDPQWQGNQDPNYPTQPGYPPQQPSYPQQPNYPQPAYPSQPLYPQYGEQQPGYPPQQGFGYGAPPSQYPGQPPYGGPPQPPRRPNRLPLILGIVGGVVLLCVVASVCALAGPLQSAFRNASATVTAQSETATVGATATPTEQTIYENALTTAQSDWQNDASCSFKADGYHITAAFICFAPPEDVQDVNVSVTAKQVSGATNHFYGLVLRRASKGNYYVFDIDSNGKWEFFVVKNNQGTAIVDLTANPAILTGLGVANTLQVTAVGSHFVFSVNGTQVGQADDSSFSSGLLGLEGDDGMDVAFTNFKATQPSA